MRTKVLVLLLFALAVLIWPVGPTWAEWFGDLYLGGAFTGRRDVNVGEKDMFRNVRFDTSRAVGGRVGYWIDDFEYLGAALDVLHFRPDISSQTVRLTTFETGPTRFAKMDVSVTALSFDLLIRYPLLRDDQFPQGRLQPYVLVAPLVAITKVDDTTNFGPPPRQSHVSSPAGFSVGTGLFWQFHKHLGVFGEYRYFQFSPAFRFVPSTDVKFTVNSHLLVGGLSFRF